MQEGNWHRLCSPCRREHSFRWAKMATTSTGFLAGQTTQELFLINGAETSGGLAQTFLFQVVASLANWHRMLLTEPTGCALTDRARPGTAAASWTSQVRANCQAGRRFESLTGARVFHRGGHQAGLPKATRPQSKPDSAFDLTVDARSAVLPAN